MAFKENLIIFILYYTHYFFCFLATFMVAFFIYLLKSLQTNYIWNLHLMTFRLAFLHGSCL